MPEFTTTVPDIERNTEAEAPAPSRGGPPLRPHTVGRDRANPPLERSAGDASQAEVFYLQKQVQSQTVMVIHLEDGERLEGKIEWYDRDAIKICSKTRQRVLVFKSAIKYIHKASEHEHAPSGPVR
jgi:sRNA-binding regulator protein Hfq